MQPPASALFVRSASPGAVLRFLERRDDLHKPSELLLSEAVSTDQWRALFAPDEYLSVVAGPLSIAFPPDVMVATRIEKMLAILIYKEGKQADMRSSLDGSSNRHWWSGPAFNLLATPDPVFAWAKEQGIPTRYIKERPKKVLDYDTVAVLDQRKLLVEDSPRLYRFPLR